MTATSTLPLEGITVLSLEHAIAAPFCTRQLADMGARVIKVERRHGGDFARSYDQRVRGMSSHFIWTNRSKESFTLDLKHPYAPIILAKLLGATDVLVQNLAPRAAARLGMTFEDLHEKYPELIVCDISGYGQGGPYEQKKAYDLLIQAESGFLSVTGTSESYAKAGCSISDIAAGMYAYSGILNALLLRHKTQVGSQVDVSMLESAVEWMGYPMYYAFEGAPPPARTGSSHSTIYPYGPFPVGADGTVLLGIQNEREWAEFCRQVLNREDLITDPRFSTNPARTSNREALREIITEVFSDMTLGEVTARLDAAQVANGSVNDMRQVWEHPQLRARSRWCTIDSPKGSLPALFPPGKNNSFMPQMKPVPDIGAHTDSILSWLGYTPSEIADLRRQAVV